MFRIWTAQSVEGRRSEAAIVSSARWRSIGVPASEAQKASTVGRAWRVAGERTAISNGALGQFHIRYVITETRWSGSHNYLLLYTHNVQHIRRFTYPSLPCLRDSYERGKPEIP